MWAVLVKRFHLYKRNIGAILVEVVVPTVLVLVGLSITLVDFNQSSDPRELTISEFPDAQ